MRAELFARGLDYVVLKRGDKGAEGLSRGGERVDVDAHNVEVRDPTGAGDCFCATFVSLIASGAFSFRQAMRAGECRGRAGGHKRRPDGGQQRLAAIEDLLASGAMSAAAKLRAIVRDNRAGMRRALPSWCTAHPDTLRAIMRRIATATSRS